MSANLRASDEKEPMEVIRTERFVEKDDGVYIKTREGLKGPYPDLASALTGLLSLAGECGLSQYQTRLLYQSVCEKALETC
ncbi:MAG: hypothetical protein OQK04_02680 [Kangiellaceae bacterium]|nr:hypothetical protein [Kangiellaceae bacterium]MCW8997610.1 hypothetical protein [Kangiellaceae bacterium]